MNRIIFNSGYSDEAAFYDSVKTYFGYVTRATMATNNEESRLTLINKHGDELQILCDCNAVYRGPVTHRIVNILESAGFDVSMEFISKHKEFILGR